MSPAGGWHGDLTGKLHILIGQHALERGLGRVFAAETGFRLDVDDEPTVRAPDIAFISKERLAQADSPGFIPIPPDLAVETLSPSDTASEVTEKVQWWLDYGVRLVWVLDPANKTLTVHHPNGRSRRLAAADTLDGGDVLPGFELPLRQMFE